MDEVPGDDSYVPQMSQMTDYTMAGMGGPPPPQQQQRYAPPGMPMNPYEQQQQHQMMMMQQQHMQHQMAAAQPPQPAPAAPPAKKPRAKSKKAQAAEAAAAAAAASQMDPMASMAAMSNNPMMRGNAYPNQMPTMYGQAPAHYPGTNGPAQQGYRPGPAGAPGQYPPNNYPYHQQQQQQQQAQAQQQRAAAAAAQPGYPPYGFPPQVSSGYPPPQQYPPGMRQQYPGQAQPPGYWEQYPYGPQGSQQAPVPPQQQQAAAPTTSQPNPMQQQQQQQMEYFMATMSSIEQKMKAAKERLQQLYNLPRNPSADQEVHSLQMSLGNWQQEYKYYQHQHYQYQQQIAAQAHQQASTSQVPTPVHVNQSGNQVQLNITADKSRTLISVYHEGYSGANNNASGSGASSTESKESIVPPEPTPSMPPQEPTQPAKMEQEKAQPQQYPGYNGMENGSAGNPYQQQQQQQQMYQQQYQQHQNMYQQQQQQQQQHQAAAAAASHMHPHQQQQQAYDAHAQQQHHQQVQQHQQHSQEVPQAQQAQQHPVPPVAHQQQYPGYPDYGTYQQQPQQSQEVPQASPVVADPTPQQQQYEQPIQQEMVPEQQQPQPQEYQVQEEYPHSQRLQQLLEEEPVQQVQQVVQQEPQEQQYQEPEPQMVPEEQMPEEILEPQYPEEQLQEEPQEEPTVYNNGTNVEPQPSQLNEEQIMMDDIENYSGQEETFGGDEEEAQEEPFKEKEPSPSPMEDQDQDQENEIVKEDEDEDMEEDSQSAKQASQGSQPSQASSEEPEDKDEDDDSSTIKEMSEEPTPSEEPSAPATPTPQGSTRKKSNYKRPAVVVAKSRKKKSADGSDDDDFYPSRKGRKGRGGGGGRKKSDVLIGEDSQDGVDADLSDDDEFLMKVEAPAPDPNALVVEKILNLRMHKVEVQKEESAEKEEAEPSASTDDAPKSTEEAAPEKAKDGAEEEPEEIEQFLIKWKGRSYVHCEWKTAAELMEIDKRVDGKIKRFRAKKQASYQEDDEDFNPDFVVVDRVVDHITEDDGQEFVLVKWKALGYEEVTWEPIEDIPEDKVELWRQRQVIDKEKIKEKSRPEPEEWKKMRADKTWKNGNSLREYQFEGVDWLLYCYYNAQNCILADEMGLGKTVQTITFLSQIYDYGIHGPFLIVVPLSTIQNWVREFETWTDMNAVVYHGSAYAREVLQQHEIFYDKRHCGAKNWKKNFVKLDALITTFETVVSDVEFLKKIPWRVCVIDEAHRLKNRNCKLLVNGLLAFRMEHRVLLTGTPLQNNIEELFSLLNFLHPQQFDNSATFLEQFGSCQTDDQVQKLQEILRPMMLRRLKEDVEKSLGPKEETIIEVQLSDMQKKFYRAILERNFSHLCKGSSAPSLMNVMMELRKCCNHPFLINGAEETILNEMRVMQPELDDEALYQRALVQASGKVVLIEKLLPKLRKDGHKVLIFSQMVKVLDLLEEFLVNMSYPFERIDGNVRGDLRQASIDRFSRQKSDRFVFLLCTRAGGLGINLTAADTVIIFDSDWNPQNDLQAQARCHRIGQKKLVKVYRLITSNTYEREMFDKASLKLGLDKAVLQSTTALKAEGTALSKKDVEELLKKGAYGSIMDEENESAKFNEEDIETILQRRTQTITLEAGQKGSLFAKATFNSTHNKGDDIDLDDPEFWTKWAEKAQVDIEKATATPDGRELIIEEPRKRTKRFEDKQDEDDSDGSDGSGGKRRRGPPGANRKRRKDDEDGDYSASYRPDELATSKAEYFKVEKVLAQFGWGRWADIKKFGEFEISEQDIEHMCRTMLLHCVREFRGDDRIRQFIFNLIKPTDANVDMKEIKSGQSTLYQQGWAALPEFNPPSFALDSAFQRHVHRHASKLMAKIDMLRHLETHIIGDERALVDDPNVKYTDIKLKEMPVIAETFVIEEWDADCDKSFLIGCWRHGLENYDAMKTDESLCFHEKNFEVWPTTSDFWVRFRRIVMASQRSVHDPIYEKLKWSKREEQEFFRVLRSFGVKELKPGPGVDWTTFKTLSPAIEKKPDEELHEQLMCVLAMCNRAQGGQDLKPIDLKRAMSVESVGSRRAVKMLNRLHLMRKVHALRDNVSDSDLEKCETNGMPAGWSKEHDKELIEICDQCGLDQLAASVLNKPAFTKIVRPSETTLIRRVIEIVSTIEAGKWCGVGDVESVNDSEVDDKKDMATIAAAQQQFLRLQQQQAAAQAAAAKKSGNRKRPNNDNDMKRMMQQLMLAGGQQGAEYAALMMLMMPQLMGASGQNMTPAQQQQMNQMLTLLLATAMQQGATPQQQQQQPSTSSAASSSKTAQAQAQAQASANQSAAAVLAQAAAASSDAAQQQQQEAILQALLAMSMNPAALAALGVTQQPAATSQPPAKKAVVKKEATPSQPSTSSASIAASQAALLAAAAAQQQQQQQAAAAKTQEHAILQLLEFAGVGVAQLNKLNTMPKDAKIPMIHKQTKEMLPEADRPAIRELTVFVMNHPEYVLDQTLFDEMNRKSSRPTPVATPKPETPKVEAPKPVTPSASATCNIKVGSSLQLDDMVSVFNRKTGELLAASKWPKSTQLAAWLEANPDYNVHSNCALTAHLALNGQYTDRVGGENAPSATPSASATPAPPLTPVTPSAPAASTSAAATAAANAAAANAQLLALAAAAQQAQQVQAQQQAQQAAAAAASKKSAAAQSSQQDQMSKQQLEMLQMQLMMQQYQQNAALQAAMLYGYMPTTSSGASTANSAANVTSMAAMAAAAQAAAVSSTPAATPSKPKKLKATSTPSTSSQAAASAAANSSEELNPLLLNAIMQNPALLQSMILSDPSMLALIAAQQQQQQQQQPAAKKPKHP